ncbi:MAG: hypothetical protein ACXWP0_19935 [Ktedonobacterales bacterium]
MRSLVLDALARGYFAMLDVEATNALKGTQIHVVPGRDAETLWPYWVTNLSTGQLLKQAVAPKYTRQVTLAGSQDFFRGLQQLGLVGWRRGRAGAIGSGYVEAGMLLRLLQTSIFEPGPRSEILATNANLWPYAEMPPE